MTDADAQVGEGAVGPVPKRFWWLKRIAVVVAILLVALGGLRWGWGRHADKILQAEIDRYRAAGQPVYPSDFDPPPVADADNAALVLENAAQALKGSTKDQDRMLDELSGHPEVSARRHKDVREIVELSAEARALARKARSMPGSDWGVRVRSPAISVLLPHLATQRRLAKVLAIAAIWHHQNGNDAEAVEIIRDMMAQADRLDEQPFLISHLVAVATYRLAGRCVEDLTPSLKIADEQADAAATAKPATRDQVRALIAELLEEDRLRRAMARSFHAERMLQLDTFDLVADGRMSLLDIGGGAVPPGPLGWVGSFLFRPLLQLDAVRMMQFTSACAQAAAASTWPAYREQSPMSPTAGSGLHGLARPLSAVLLPSFGRAVMLHFHCVANRRMTAVALAIRMYQLDHGRWPKTLDELVPKYLPSVPQDPYAPAGRNIGYQPDGDRPVLYSVSVDGADDKGAFDVDRSGGLNWEAKDIPFFLDGGRPHRGSAASAPAPTSSQADKDQRNVDGRKRNAEERQGRDRKPHDRQQDRQ